MSGISERIKTAALKEKISRGDALGVSPAAPYLPNITVRQKDAGQKRETLKNSREALEKASENISGRFALNSGSGIVKNIRYFTQERELEQQISHAREMENTYSELHGSHKTTAQEKQAALEQKNRFAAEAREAEGKLESLRAQKPYSTFDPYKSISERADFKAYAAKGAAISNEYKTSEVEGAVTGWEFFSEEEKDIYNYILGKYGDEAAKRYWNYMQEPTRQRQGEIYKQRLDAIDSDIGRGTAKAAFGFLSGIENAMGGLVQAVTKEELPTSGVQYGSQMIRNELGGAGAVGYDLLYSTGNMLPSMFLSGALGAAGVPAAGAIGSGALGVSAGGNAYKQALSEGYGAQEAAAYGRIIGISESCMQYLLGGISKLGGTSAAIAKRVEGIEKGFIRGIAKTGGAVISEASEEALQSIVEPIFRHAIFGEDAEIDWAEVAYSALLGGLSGGMLEGPGIISSEMAAGRAKVGTAAPTGSGENESTIMTRGDAGTITQDNKKTSPRQEETQSADINGIELPTAQSSGTMLPTAEQAEATVEKRRAMERTTTETERSGIAAGADEETIKQAERLAKVTGREIIFFSEAGTENGTSNGYYAAGKIYINAQSRNPLAQIIAHELTHSVEMAESYGQLRDMIIGRIRQNGDLQQLRQQKKELYTRNGAMLESESDIDSEIVAEYVEKHLLTDESSIRELVRESRTLGERILEWINRVLARLGNEAAKERAFLNRARNVYAQALSQSSFANQSTADAGVSLEALREAYASGEISDEEFDTALEVIMEQESAGERDMLDAAGRERFSIEQSKDMILHVARTADGERILYDVYPIKKTGQSGNSDTSTVENNIAENSQNVKAQYSISETYRQELEEWERDGRPDGEIFSLGYTGDTLQGLGAMEQSIYLQSDKANAILREHPEMTLEEIGRIPEMLDDPVLILKSRNNARSQYGNSRLVIFGTVHAKDGRPVMAVLDLRPTEGNLLINDMQKVNSAYTKDTRPVEFISASEVLHADKKRTLPLLRGMGFAMPMSLLRSDSVGSIYYSGKNVKLEGVPFDEVVDTGTTEGQTFELPKMANAEPAERSIYQTAGNVIEVNGENLQEEAEPDIKQYSIELPRGEDTRSAGETDDDIINRLPTKARQYLRRTERELVDKVGALLSVPEYARREGLQEIVREISGEYMRDGTVSQQTIDELFERAYDEGIEVDSEFYDNYRHIKEHLRTQAVTLSERDRADIPDWNSFRKSAFGTLRIVNDGGTPVNMAYSQLQDMAPELFPDDITHPAEQLGRMFEVGQSIRRVERSLSEVYGHDAEEFKRWAKYDFDAAINEALGELQRVKRYADERNREAEPGQELTQEQITAMYGQLKDARKAYEKLMARNLLTRQDEEQIGRLLRGEAEIDQLDPKKYNVKGIKAVYEARQEYERLCKSIREWNAHRKAKLRQTADGLLETANDWKDKKAGILYSRETMERNIRDIIEDTELAEQIINEYFKPVHDAQARSTRMKNRYRERVKALELSRKIEKGNTVSEAHAVQLLGEAEDCLRMLEQGKGRIKMRDGRTAADWRGIINRLWDENPMLDRAKIEAAVKEFRNIYDELFRQMNDSRVRNGYEPVNYRSGYFPHFQPGSNDGILGQFGKALGIDMGTEALPTTINGLTHTFKPGIQWFGNAQQRLGFNTVYDAVEGFDRYIEGVADVVYQTDNIQKLRALATQTRYRTSDEGIRKQIDAVMNDTTLDETDRQNRIEKIYENGRCALSNFVVELEEYTNLLANKKSRADRNMEQALGRGMYRLTKKLESRVAANMVAINPASWLTNFIPLTQGGALLDRGTLMRGMWDTLKAYKTDDGIVDKSTFLTNRRGSDPIVKAWDERLSAKMSSPMEYIDQFTADSLVRARYRQNVRKGLSEDAAMSEADSWAAGVMADRSKGSTPTLFNRSDPLTKVFTQFQLEVNNQLSYLFKDIPRDTRDKGLKALAAALIKFVLGAFLYDEIYEYVIGRRPALDPLGILNDTVGDITGYELPNLVELGRGALTGDMPDFRSDRENAYKTVENLTSSMAENLPFIGGVLEGGRVPISSAMPDFENLGKAMLNDEWDDAKRWGTAAKELGNPATYLALPFGGGQLKKIFQGIKAVLEGGSYTTDAQGNEILQYPVYSDDPAQAILNTAGAVIFGKTSLPTGRDWVERGFKNLSAAETACYKAMLEAGTEGREAFRLLESMKNAKKSDGESESAAKLKILREAELSGESRSIVYYALISSDGERETMDALSDEADMSEAANVLMSIRDAGSMTGAEKANAKRSAIMDALLSDEDKKTMYRHIFGSRQDNGSYASRRDDDIQAFEQAGMSFDQFLQACNEFATISEEHSNAGERATEFSRWVNSQMLTAEQAETVRSCFYSQMPTAAERYNEFVAAGIDEEAAYSLANALDDLEPEEGRENVSKLQKYRTVINAGLTESEQMTVLSGIMSESDYAKLETGRSFGVTPEAYVTFREYLLRYDADGNGSFNQSEVEAAINAMSGSEIILPTAGGSGSLNLTNDIKAALWQMANKSWKPKNNPYSTSTGQQVYTALNTENGK